MWAALVAKDNKVVEALCCRELTPVSTIKVCGLERYIWALIACLLNSYELNLILVLNGDIIAALFIFVLRNEEGNLILANGDVGNPLSI